MSVHMVHGKCIRCAKRRFGLHVEVKVIERLHSFNIEEKYERKTLEGSGPYFGCPDRPPDIEGANLRR